MKQDVIHDLIPLPTPLPTMHLAITADPSFSHSLVSPDFPIVYNVQSSSLPAFPIDGLNTNPVPSLPGSPASLSHIAFDFDAFLRSITHDNDDSSSSGSSTAKSPESGGNVASAASPRPLSPTNPQRPPIRPNSTQRSNFALEPNPFEQSFSRSSHHSQSSISDRATPPRGGDATSLKNNALPPLSSLTSPAAADPTQFPWLSNHSLRSGPLSPAILAGPQHGNGHHQHNPSSLRQGIQAEQNANQEGGFDSNTFRTGFTPGTGSGFTPGFGSLMNGNFSTLPMPSPNTAAFLNMVTNSTPLGEGGEGHGANAAGHHDGQHPHPPSAIPPHLQHHGLSHIQRHPDVQQETITPNTLSALTGVFNDMNRANANAPHPPQAPYFSHDMHPHGAPPGAQVDYAQQSANAASQAANGLFLLSQAHHELSKREEAEGRQTTPLLNKKTSIGALPPGSGKPPNINPGQKRKSDGGMPGKPAPPKKGKKGPGMTPTPDKMTKMESVSPSFSMLGSDDEDGEMKELSMGGDKNETEEEKRKNFLERNRQGERGFWFTSMSN